MLAASSAWEGLAAELNAAAEAFSSVTSGLTSQGWQGQASQSMLAVAAPYGSFLGAAAQSASGAAAQSRAVASAFESALAATVHPALVYGNRQQLIQAVQSNWFGLNFPVIAELDAVYESQWAQDVAAMFEYYSSTAAAAAQVALPQQPLPSLPGAIAGD